MSKILCYLTLPLLLLLSSSGNSAPTSPSEDRQGQTGTLERMLAANGIVAINLDLNRLSGNHLASKESKRDTLRFEITPNSFFTIRVFDHVLRDPEPGSMALRSLGVLPEPLNASSNQLVIEKMPLGEPFD